VVAPNQVFETCSGFPSVDAGHDGLIFALPQAELAVHPADDDVGHELYLMCDDLQAEIAALAAKGSQTSEVGGVPFRGLNFRAEVRSV